MVFLFFDPPKIKLLGRSAGPNALSSSFIFLRSDTADFVVRGNVNRHLAVESRGRVSIRLRQRQETRPQIRLDDQQI